MSEVEKVKYVWIDGTINGIVWVYPDTLKYDKFGNHEIVPGKKVVYQTAQYETDDKDIIEFLDKHEYYGINWVRLDAPKETPIEQK